MRAARLGLLLLLTACGPPRPGHLSGDAFLVEDVGREVNLAGMEVRLLAEPSGKAALDSALALTCPSRDAPPPVSAAAHARAWRDRADTLAPHVRATTRTDRRARFAFPAVPPGRYRLWADTVVDSVRWSWLHPVRVRPGDTVRVELSNANPDENPFRCGPRPAPPTDLRVKS